MGNAAGEVRVPIMSPNPFPGGTRYSPEIMDKMEILFNFDDKNNLLAQIYKAHKLRDGTQSYTEAAAIYRKGAKLQNAEAMYNLALLKLEGAGVKQDVKGGIDLLKRAAKQSLKDSQSSGISFMSNVGVVESSFVLGLLAASGIGFPPQRDPFSASHYYQEASDHGHGPASHNLACLYNSGIGVAKNEKRALQLWKLAASRRVPEAMFALALHFAKEWETLEAMKWLQLSIQEYQNDPQYPCALHHNNKEHFPDNVSDISSSFLSRTGGKGWYWYPTPTLVQEFITILHTLDQWRGRYPQKDISRWELNTGLKTKDYNLPLKQRLTKMLHHLQFEKEKIQGVEEYFKYLNVPRSIIPFPRAKQWALQMRQEVYLSLGSEGEGGTNSRSSSQQSGRTRTVSSSMSVGSQGGHLTPPPEEQTNDIEKTESA